MSLVVPFVMIGAAAILIPVVCILAIRLNRKNNEITQNGICANSVVVSNERRGQYYRTVVRFMGDDGQKHDCALQYRGGLPVGRRVRIQYLPGHYDEVMFISQELGSENQEVSHRENTY